MKKDSAAFIVVGIVIKFLLALILVLALIYAGRQAYSFGYSVFSGETVSSPPGKKVAITVTEDMTVSEIADLLEARELIKDANVFKVQYHLSEYKGEIKQGSYVLNNSQTAEEMLAILTAQDKEETETEET